MLHPRYNSIPAENRIGDTFSLKITDKVLYIQRLDRSRYDSLIYLGLALRNLSRGGGY